MPVISAKNLKGVERRRWSQNRREIYRSVLRDPRSSQAQKAQARKKIDDTKDADAVPPL